MSAITCLRRWLPLLLLAVGLLEPAAGADCYALVVSGDPGHLVSKLDNTLGDWSTNFDRWREGWRHLLSGPCQVPADHLAVLRSADPQHPELAVPDAELASRSQVLAGIGSLVARSHADDQVLLVLIGHGYHQGVSGHFCLGTQDLTDGDLAEALKPLHCKQLVVLVLAPDCRDIARSLAGPGRVVVLGNIRSSAPYFSEFLLRALAPGTVPLLTAFNQASLATIHWYQNQVYLHEKKAWVVHGAINQVIWRLVYPRGPMLPGDAEPHTIVNTNDPNQVTDMVGRRVIAEVAGLADQGDGTPATVYDAGPVPTPIPGDASGPCALSATLLLGKP